MKKVNFIVFGIFILSQAFFGCIENQKMPGQRSGSRELEIINPFASNNGVYPPDSVYAGPFFEANYNYPTEFPMGRQYPWGNVLEGQPLSAETAAAYILPLGLILKRIRG